MGVRLYMLNRKQVFPKFVSFSHISSRNGIDGQISSLV